jgi:hypothetical protein
MKTHELISLLSTGTTPVDRHLQWKAFSRATVIGGVAAVVMTLLLFGIRPDIGVMLKTPMFWLKVAFPLTLAATALLVLPRASRPGAVIGKRWLTPAMPVLVIWMAALAVLVVAPPDQRYQLIMGDTWEQCPFNIVLLSIPACVSIVRALRQMAPTRMRMAGGFGGLLAGALATMAYCLHCPEMGIPFWGIWYLLGMLIPAALGALFGPSLLRW